MYAFMFVKCELKSNAFVQATSFYTQVFVFYFIDSLCSVELMNKNINILIIIYILN